MLILEVEDANKKMEEQDLCTNLTRSRSGAVEEEDDKDIDLGCESRMC